MSKRWLRKPSKLGFWLIIIVIGIIGLVGLGKILFPISPTANNAAEQKDGASVWKQRGTHGTRSASPERGQRDRDASSRDPSKRPVAVVATIVRTGSITYTQTALGTVTPMATVIVRPRVDGQLLQFRVQEGSMVKAGQVLAELDSRSLQAAAKQVQGQLLRDQAQLRMAQLDLQRYKTLWDEDAIAKQQYEAQVELVKQYQGVVLTDQGAVDNAKLQLSFTKVVAPVAGKVGLRAVDTGNMVHASDANGLLTITQTQPITALFSIPEINLVAVRQRLQQNKTPLVIEAWDRSNQSKLLEGVLHSIDNQIDLSTGTVKLRALFENKNDLLFPNQFINIKLVLDKKNNALLMPTAAILRGTPGTYVYVIQNDQTVKIRQVTVGAEEGTDTEVLSGLSAGDKIVVEGSDKLREGSKVTHTLSPRK